MNLEHADHYICIIVKQRGSKYGWMVALMISSQLLLTGFVTYWLISQFRQEKIELHVELKQAYLKTHDQLVDTLLLQHLIAPSLNDSSAPEVIMKHFSMDSAGGPEIFALQVEGSLDHDSMVIDSSIFFKVPEEEMLVRSVKLFINQTDEAFRTNPSIHAFSMKIDSTRFKHQLKESLDGHDQSFTLEWIEQEHAGLDPDKTNGLLLQGYPSVGVPKILVQHYNAYIVRAIMPQILFGFIMLGLSASALLFAYRSLRKQLVLNKLRDDFIGNISHELKTPVSTVKLALEALGTFDLKKDPKVSGDYLQMASREVERLEGLVSKVLHHEAMEDPSISLQKETCDLSEMVQNVLHTLEIPIRESGADVSVDVPEESCAVVGDPVYLEGVIINLLDNSLKYAGPRPVIQIIITSDSHSTILSVQDNGPGIPEEFKNQIFEKFFRIPSGDRHDVKGYGLGLNFASQVMAHHGGSISVKNLSTRGCVFSLHFSGEPA